MILVSFLLTRMTHDEQNKQVDERLKNTYNAIILLLHNLRRIGQIYQFESKLYNTMTEGK